MKHTDGALDNACITRVFIAIRAVYWFCRDVTTARLGAFKAAYCKDQRESRFVS